ncbi:MFS transporter [Kineosporia sp. NBRC 101731]|nr:MFS transporter [Kineosporia sp. NBRC 101731]GLY30812.1 MFS transporter [Kineosporia sp. NBRC 101731]
MPPTPEATSMKATEAGTAHGEHHSTRWWILAVACLAQLMVVLDATIVNIALPTAQQDIGFSNDSRQWVVTGYALAFGSLLLVGGRLGDLVGRKTTFMVGLVGFAGASALGGTATTFGLLVGARAGQGVFGALLAPAALSLLTTTFTDPHERGRAFAVFGALSGAGGAIGLILGGALTEYLSWRWCLYVNLPIAVIALAGGFLLLPRQPRDEDAAGLDIAGSVLSVAGLVSLVYGLASAETDGWTSGKTLGFIVAGLVLLVVFAWSQTRVASPLLPLAVLLDRNRGGSFLSVAFVGAGMFGVFLFLTYYLTTILGYEPLPTGLAFLPMIGGIMFSAQTSPALVERIGVKVPVTAGFLIAAVGMVWFSRLALDSSYAGHVLPGLIVVGLGIGLIIAPAMSAATDRVDPDHAGVASAAVNTFQQIGGSIGTAVFSAVAASAANEYLVGKNPADAAVVAGSYLESYTTAFLWAAFVFAAGAVISGVLLRHGALVRDPDAAPVMAH